MAAYYIFTAVIVSIQIAVLVQAARHLLYTRRKYRPEPSTYQPRLALISPCKGLDTTFDRNIDSFFHLDYPDYEIFFVVESTQDPAYQLLLEIIDKYSSDADSARRAHIVVAGLAQGCSQKLHNLLAVCDTLPENFQVMAFVDSDITLKSHFLTSLVDPLQQPNVGASTGYRWFVPVDNRLSTAVLSAMNAFFASILGPHPWNSTWGGAMALRREIYDQINLSHLWRHALSDDYALAKALKEAGLLVTFAPACFVASHEKTSWSNLISFARRQFIITRVYMPRLWILALLGLGHFVVAFWTGFFVTLVLYIQDPVHAPYAAILPGFLLVSSFLKATARQAMIRKILPDLRKQLVVPALIDIFLQPILALFTLVCLLSTALTRVIVWRGIRYLLHKGGQVEILTAPSES